MTVIWFLIMILAAVGMIFGLIKDRQGFEWGKPLTIVCAVVALLLAFGSIISGGGSKVDVEKIQNREASYNRIAGEKMGLYLAGQYPGTKVLIIKNIDMGMPNKMTEAQITGLKKGFGNQIAIAGVVHPPIPEQVKQMMEQAPEGMPPEDFGMMAMEGMFEAKQFNQIFQEHGKNVDIIVSLIGLPMDVENMTLWNMSKPPKLALFNAMYIPNMKQAISRNYVTAMLAYKPNADFRDETVPKNIEDFDKRFLLITPQNIEQMATEYSMLFPEG